MSKQIVSIQVRNLNKGTELFFKSVPLEEFFRSLHFSQGYTNEDFHKNKSWGKHRGYIAPDMPIFSQFQYFGGRLYEKGKPNLSFLCTVGLSEGVSIRLLNTIVNDKILDQFIEDFKKELARVYQEYFTPLNLEESIDI